MVFQLCRKIDENSYQKGWRIQVTFQGGGEENRNVNREIKTNQDYFDVQNIDIIVIVISVYT